MSVKRKEQTTGANARSVLIVDDEEDILELIELTLLRMGLDVDRATTVKTAIEKVQSGNYDLWLTDMRLPDGDELHQLQALTVGKAKVVIAGLVLLDRRLYGGGAVDVQAHAQQRKLDELKDVFLVVDDEH